MKNRSEKSIAQHKELITYLQNRDLANASKVLAENNMVGVDSLIESLKENK
jgi:hypothetical protein